MARDSVPEQAAVHARSCCWGFTVQPLGPSHKKVDPGNGPAFDIAMRPPMLLLLQIKSAFPGRLAVGKDSEAQARGFFQAVSLTRRWPYSQRPRCCRSWGDSGRNNRTSPGNLLPGTGTP